MDEVAAAVGVTKPLLYNYFGNKEQLFLACMKPAGGRARRRGRRRRRERPTTPGDALRAGIHAFFAFLDGDRDAWRCCTTRLAAAGGEIAARVDEYRERDGGAGHGLAARAAAERSRAAEVESSRSRWPSSAPPRRWAAGGCAPGRSAPTTPPSSDSPRSNRDCSTLAPTPHPSKEDHDEHQDRRVAVVGGNRIPFARSNGAYAHASDQDMLTATLDGLVERFGLEGERLGEVVAGAVLKHARDRDLTRESVLGSQLAPETPAYDVQQACGTGLETAITVANKIALGQIDVGIAGGVDTASDAPIAVNEDLRNILLDLNRAKSLAGARAPLTRLRPGTSCPEIPRNEEPRTGLSMGEHAR